MLSRADERIGLLTPQQPINVYKVLKPTRPRALNDDFNEIKTD